MWNTRGLRGNAFEEMINMTNQLYRQHKLALIQKIPTPITPIEVSNKEHIITKAYFGEKSTVDYIGVVQGIAVCFDAKETQTKNLPLQNVHQHQIDFMEAFEKQDGVAFLLVLFKITGEIFFIPSKKITQYHKLANSGGRKSIPYKDMDKEFIVTAKSGFPVHYIETLSRYLEMEKFNKV